MNDVTPRLRATLVLLLGLAACLPAAAQWKWRDASGKVQYSDRPPPAAVPEKDILQRPAGTLRVAPTPAPAASSADAGASVKPTAPPVDKELEARKKKEEQEQDAKRRAEEEKLAKARAENCSRARGYLQSLESGMRIARTNDKGEREILDDAARAQEVQRARQVIASDCK